MINLKIDNVNVTLMGKYNNYNYNCRKAIDMISRLQKKGIVITNNESLVVTNNSSPCYILKEGKKVKCDFLLSEPKKTVAPKEENNKTTLQSQLVKIKNGKKLYGIFSPKKEEKKRRNRKPIVKLEKKKSKSYPLMVLPNHLNSYRYIDNLLSDCKKVESNDFIDYCLKLSHLERSIVILSHAIANNVLKALTTNRGNSFRNDYFKAKVSTFKLDIENQTTKDCISIIAEKLLQVIKKHDLQSMGEKYFNNNILETLLEYDFINMKVALLKIALNVPLLQYSYYSKEEKKVEKVYSIVSHYAWNTIYDYNKTAFSLSEKAKNRLLTIQLNKLLESPTIEQGINIESIKAFLESLNTIDYFILKKVYHGYNFTEIAKKLESNGLKKMSKQAISYRYRKLVEKAKVNLQEIYIEHKL